MFTLRSEKMLSLIAFSYMMARNYIGVMVVISVFALLFGFNISQQVAVGSLIVVGAVTFIYYRRPQWLGL